MNFDLGDQILTPGSNSKCSQADDIFEEMCQNNLLVQIEPLELD